VLTPEEDNMVKIDRDVNDHGHETGVAIVSFNVPDKLNALTVELGKVFEKKMRKLRSMLLRHPAGTK
jgi:enoyl-CoA hydratase/carnithine racemase